MPKLLLALWMLDLSKPLSSPRYFPRVFSHSHRPGDFFPRVFFAVLDFAVFGGPQKSWDVSATFGTFDAWLIKTLKFPPVLLHFDSKSGALVRVLAQKSTSRSSFCSKVKLSLEFWLKNTALLTS